VPDIPLFLQGTSVCSQLPQQFTISLNIPESLFTFCLSFHVLLITSWHPGLQKCSSLPEQLLAMTDELQSFSSELSEKRTQGKASHAQAVVGSRSADIAQYFVFWIVGTAWFKTIVTFCFVRTFIAFVLGEKPFSQECSAPLRSR
jgi:hypothetical protein